MSYIRRWCHPSNLLLNREPQLHVHVHLLLQVKILKEESSFKSCKSHCFSFLHLNFSKWHNYLSKDILDFVFHNLKRRVQHKTLWQFQKFVFQFQTWISLYCQGLARTWLTLPHDFFTFGYLIWYSNSSVEIISISVDNDFSPWRRYIFKRRNLFIKYVKKHEN